MLPLCGSIKGGRCTRFFVANAMLLHSNEKAGAPAPVSAAIAARYANDSEHDMLHVQHNKGVRGNFPH